MFRLSGSWRFVIHFGDGFAHGLPLEFEAVGIVDDAIGDVLTRAMLLEAVWDFHFDPKTNVVETHISRLRNKIDKPFDADLIHTVRGAGYSCHA